MPRELRRASPPSIASLGRTVWHDIRHERVDRSFRRDMEDIYCFYLDEHTRGRLAGMGRVRRCLTLPGWLLHALIRTLPPARRLLLLAGLGFFVFSAVRDAEGLSHLHVMALSVAAVLLVLMLELKDKLVARDELEVGRAVQCALLPDRDPELPGWDIALFSRPANDVGGDLVDYLAFAPHRLGLALGDVAGKGLGAALLMAKLQATIRAVVRHVDTLEELGSTTNRIFLHDGLPGRFATLVYLEITAESGAVRLLNAGHQPPWVIRPTRIDELEPVSMPLGLLPDSEYHAQRVELSPGDYLVLCSDGVTEAQNRAGDLFDEARLRVAVLAARGAGARQVVDAIHEAVAAFIANERPSDDLSIIVLRRTGSPGDP